MLRLGAEAKQGIELAPLVQGGEVFEPADVSSADEDLRNRALAGPPNEFVALIIVAGDVDLANIDALSPQ
jgi:hypothetical protein